MSTNTEIAAIFSEMAAMLELTGANRFRVISYENAARVLKDLTTDVATLSDSKKQLTDIEGIGSGSADRIIEYVQTGAMTDHQKLRDAVPAGLLEVMRIPGLGAKTVKLMWEQAEVTDLSSLEAAIDSGTLEALPRMGKKKVENIRKSIQYLTDASKRMRMGQALPVAERIVAMLAAMKEVNRADYAGSLRRGRETIGDIDILAGVTGKPEAIATKTRTIFETFTGMENVEQIIAAGGTKASVRIARGFQVDLRVLPDDVYGAALMYFTGSKQHNVKLRERALRMGYRLNEYGLFAEADVEADESTPQSRGVTPVAAKTENDIYAALDLPYIEPELREDRSELSAAEADELPTLIQMKDIKAELHAHTKASDGRLTIEDLAEAAKARGFHTIAVTDHSVSSVQANGLNAERLREHVEAVGEVDARIDGITVLAGSEVDILTDGALDYDDEVLMQLDIVVASPHAVLNQPADVATARLIRAIEHPAVHIIGHPTGRVINKRDGLALQMDSVIAAAIEHDVALEINANFMRLDLRDTHVKAAVDAGALLAINTDVHAERDFDQLKHGVMTARRGWLTAAQCINTWSAKKLHGWLKKKR